MLPAFALASRGCGESESVGSAIILGVLFWKSQGGLCSGYFFFKAGRSVGVHSKKHWVADSEASNCTLAAW